MSTPVVTSSTNDQSSHSRPNSRMGVDITQAGSTVPCSALSQGGSLVSGTVLSQSGSSVPSGEISRSGSSALAALPRMTSSIFQAADNHHPFALRPAALSLSKPDESGVNNNNEDVDEFESNLDNNDNNSASVES
jgi:hypothetical protein